MFEHHLWSKQHTKKTLTCWLATAFADSAILAKPFAHSMSVKHKETLKINHEDSKQVRSGFKNGLTQVEAFLHPGQHVFGVFGPGFGIEQGRLYSTVILQQKEVHLLHSGQLWRQSMIWKHTPRTPHMNTRIQKKYTNTPHCLKRLLNICTEEPSEGIYISWTSSLCSLKLSFKIYY